MTNREALLAGSDSLKAGPDPDTAWLDATILLCHTLKIEKKHLYAEFASTLSEANLSRFLALCRERASGRPVAYITGTKEFFGHSFFVDESVLIPRPETEILVEWALELIRADKVPAADGICRVHDCCTGTACIPVSLALSEIGTSMKLSASDISRTALETARRNLDFHRLAASVDIIESDLLDRVPGGISLLTANPPYVERRAVETPETRARGEPELALDGGEDGLSIIEKLIVQARRKLARDGILLMEFGFGQGSRILDILGRFGYLDCVIRNDLAGIERIVCARSPG